MKYRKFGERIPWEVSALGFGAMRMPSIGMFLKKKKAVNLIRHAFDKGINYVDSGWMYHLGKSESAIGEALQGGYREKVHVVTKLPMMTVKKQEDFDKYLNAQLEKLQTDYLDIYHFHGLNQGLWDRVQELNLIKKMEEAKESGIIKHVGFSFHDTLPSFKNIIDSYDGWDCVQIQYNYMDTGIQAGNDGLKYAHEKGLGVIIMEPVKGGVLANPPKEALDVFHKAKVKRTPVDWALQFLWDKPEISIVLSGMGNTQMVDQNCASADRSGINSLSDEDRRVLKEVVDIYRERIKVPCTACQYCMPCPSGVNIPQNFAILNNVSLKKSAKFNINQWFYTFLIKRRYKKMAKNREQLQSNPNNGNASLCTRCMQCIEKCPQSIQIPDELEKVDLVFGKGKKIDKVF